MTQLYPIKFIPILKEKIWGGNRLKNILNKEQNDLSNIGESWELSAIPTELSIVSNGRLKGKNIEEVITEYKSDLVGEKVYLKFGSQFPLLIKFIDANDYLSIQVHPDDEMALARHNSFGKTEMWYVVDAEPDAKLIIGFNQAMDKDKYLKCMNDGNLKDVLNFEDVMAGDVLYMPAGRIHATGPGILFAEIQQTSDVTYRIYDWDRLDDSGNSRELHTELAADTIDFKSVTHYKTQYNTLTNKSNTIVSNAFFTTNILDIDSQIDRNYYLLHSFVVLMAIEGSTKILYNHDFITINKGETLLIPTCLKELILNPVQGNSKLLEVYID